MNHEVLRIKPFNLQGEAKNFAALATRKSEFEFLNF